MNRLLEIEAFVAVVEHGSFSAAAKQLGISTSYASKLVTRLEDRTGVRVLHRTTRKLTLTEPGARYFEHCRDAFEALSAADEALNATQATPRGRIRITVPTAMGLCWLTDALTEFTSAHSALVLDVVYTDRIKDLLDERFDLAIRAGALPDSSLFAKRIANDRLGLVASPDWMARQAPLAHPDELPAFPCMTYSGQANPGAWTLQREGEEVHVEVFGPLVTNNGAALATAATKQLGIAYIPGFHTQAHERAGRLVRVLPEWGYPIPIHAVYPGGRHVPVNTRALIDFLVDYKLRADAEA